MILKFCVIILRMVYKQSVTLWKNAVQLRDSTVFTYFKSRFCIKGFVHLFVFIQNFEKMVMLSG